MVFLIGMPGAGKTYWGGRIAEAFKFPFIDLDLYIAKQQGRSIAEIFAADGEVAFRQMECLYLSNIIANQPKRTVVATGGGTPCYFQNMKLMKAAGRVIYLKSTISELLTHLQADNNTRPLLANQPDVQEYLELTLARRSAIYEQADLILQTADISLFTFVEIVRSCSDPL